VDQAKPVKFFQYRAHTTQSSPAFAAFVGIRAARDGLPEGQRTQTPGTDSARRAGGNHPSPDKKPTAVRSPFDLSQGQEGIG